MRYLINTLTFLIILVPLSAFARPGEGGGHGVGGGGDSCETRIHEIRKDLLSWVDRGGAKRLNFANTDVTLETYTSSMREVLKQNAVVVYCVKPTRENPIPIQVHGKPKTCKAVPARGNELATIACDYNRFYLDALNAGAKAEAAQYRLNHHEFAGLAGVERNDGAASDYVFSDQITDFLEPFTTLKLAVKAGGPKKIIGELLDRNEHTVAARKILFAVLSEDPSVIAAYEDPQRREESALAQKAVRAAVRKHLRTLGVRALVFADSSVGEDTMVVSVYDKRTDVLLYVMKFARQAFAWPIGRLVLNSIYVRRGPHSITLQEASIRERCQTASIWEFCDDAK